MSGGWKSEIRWEFRRKETLPKIACGTVFNSHVHGHEPAGHQPREMDSQLLRGAQLFLRLQFPKQFSLKDQKLIAYGDISRILEGTIKKGSTDIKRPGCGDDVFKTQDASHDNCIWSRRPNIVRASLSSFNFPNALHMTCCVWSRLMGQWAFPGGTAIPGRPSTESEQAPKLYPLTKISLISTRHMVLVSDIKLIRTDTTLWS